MLIKYVEIENFKSHRSSRVEFDRGVNLIVGRNGAGKTSILEAIAVALYGVKHGVKPSGVKKDDLIRDSASRYEIRLGFDFNGRDCLIVRSSDGNSYLRCDKLLEGDERIREWVERNVAPSHVWLNAIYVRQGEIDEIVKDDERREKIIKRITQIEDYERAWENLGKVIKHFKEEKSRLEKEIKAESDVENRIKEVKEELEAKKRELDKKMIELRDVEEKLAEAEAEKERVEKLREKFEELNREKESIEKHAGKIEERIRGLRERRNGLKKEIEELKSRVRRLEEIRGYAEKYIELREEYEKTLKVERELKETLARLESERNGVIRLLSDLENKKKRLNELKGKLEEVEKRKSEIEGKALKYEEIKVKLERLRELEKTCRPLEEIERELEEVERAKLKLKDVEKDERNLLDMKARLESEIERLKEALNALKSAKGVCPTCGRLLSEDDRLNLIKSYTKKLENVRKDLIEIENKLEDIKNVKKELESVISEESRILREYELAKELENLKKSTKGFEEAEAAWKEYRKLEELALKLSADISVIESDLKSEQELNSKLIELNSKIDEVEEKLSNLKKIDESTLKELESYYNEFNRLVSAKHDLERKLEELKSCESEIVKAEDELSETLKRLESLKNEIEALGYSDETYRNVYNLYTELRSRYFGLREGVERLKDHIKTLEKSAEDLENRVKKLREKRERVEKIGREVLPKLEEIREKFRKYKVSLTEYAFKEVEKIASEIFEEMTDGKYSGIVLKREEKRKEKVTVKVLYQGAERDISFLSGGELIALGLAFRLALSVFMIQGKIPLLILDEPTPFLDDERRRKLVDIMNRYLKKIPQVIVVTHDEELRDVADKVIRVELHGGVSKVMEGFE
ncbi:DNA double-strand break repair ATPase Rad50 [Archaeoglobus profundus]|uniref:DNA double-strand break repair Rad50 ATPase n=1 Tax=Archaeoglobus profundus (strain DSM 5631 / JCM 9629 / NBRC 100127 / Av18) TaxID=572546 RepID=D2RFR1_ARCPA|nr:DNA double-strand break repair ATPase Rad50 [Archaeoglobus profundus]ADB57136.1 SMC domain protein [Archaeoglobus profundus DSM 5631]